MTNQIALITGASRGLGRNMALHLAKRGIHIIGTYRSGAAEAEPLPPEIASQGGKAALLPLVEDGGRILNVSSGFVRFTLPGYSVYAAVKAAVEVLTRYMAVELGSRQIRVNAIAPGAIATD